MRLPFLLLFIATTAHAQDPLANAKKLEAACEKLKSKDSAAKLEALKELGRLKSDAILALPLIFKEMIGDAKKPDERLILQAVIACEAIDPELHGCIMGVKPGSSWSERAEPLLRINHLPDARIKRLECLFEWLIPQLKSLKMTLNLRPKLLMKDKKGNPVWDSAGGDEKALEQLLCILPKFGDRFADELEELARNSIRCGNAYTREWAYRPFWAKAKQPDTSKDKKEPLLAMFLKGLADPEPDIQRQCIEHIGHLGAEAKSASEQLRRIAATHANKDFRAAANEALERIEADPKTPKAKEKPKKIVPITIDPPKDKK
jgi:hypothetical protein